VIPSQNFSLTQLDNGRLSIKSGKFKAVVPCLDPELMQNAFPDPNIAPITNAFKEAVEAVGVLASENAQHVLTASVLMNGPSVISTNRVMIMEYWHGLDLPPGVPLPKQFVAALAKQKKNLVGFGFSNNSATFHFEDGCWIKTQLYSDEWPDVSKILNREANLWSIDAGFYKALDAVAAFSEDGNVYSDLNLLMSHSDSSIGATHECAGIPKGFVYPIKQLKIIQPHVQKIDWMANGIHDSGAVRDEGIVGVEHCCFKDVCKFVHGGSGLQAKAFLWIPSVLTLNGISDEINDVEFSHKASSSVAMS